MYRTFTELLQPYPLLCLLTTVGCINLWRKRVENRFRLALLSVPLAGLVLISLPAVARLLHMTLEWRLPQRTDLPKGNQALVVLAGWSIPADDRRPRPLLGVDSIYRCLHAAELYHRDGPCLIVVSGGVAEPEKGQPPVAPLMREFLCELQVAPDDVLIEDRSTTTYENAMECREILSPRGVDRITLVTNAIHMLRAARCFGRAGFEVTPAPCNSTAPLNMSVSAFLPSCEAARASDEAAHEWLGLAWYWLRGRI